MGNLGSLLSFSGESVGGTGGGVGGVVAIAAIAQGMTTAAIAATGLAAAMAPIAGPIMQKVSSEWGAWSKQIQGTPDAKKAIGAAGQAFQPASSG
jgi:hypothetical protein